MKIEKIKTLKEFKTALKKQYSNSLKNASLENAFIVSYYPLFLIVSKKSDSIIYHEIELDRENSYIFKSVYQNQKDFLRTIDFIMECQKTKREFFVSEVDKGIISISNFYKVPISNITTPTLLDVQKNMRFLNSFESKEKDLNDLKKYIEVNWFITNQKKCILSFESENIYLSDGFYYKNIAKNIYNKTGFFRVELDNFQNQDFNEVGLVENKIVNFETNIKYSDFLFTISKKEFDLMIKQAITCKNPQVTFDGFYFVDGVFFTENDGSYQYFYEFDLSIKGEFCIFMQNLIDFKNKNKDKEISFYKKENNLFIKTENNSLLVIDIEMEPIKRKEILKGVIA